MIAPPCFESQQEFDEWIALDNTCNSKRDRMTGGYCRDCTADFALQMRREGRCIQPQVRFELNQEGERVGVGFSPILAEGANNESHAAVSEAHAGAGV